MDLWINDIPRRLSNRNPGKQTHPRTKKPNQQLKIPEGPRKFHTHGGSTYQTQDLHVSQIALAEPKRKRNELKLKPGDEALASRHYHPHDMDQKELQDTVENGKQGNYKEKREDITLPADFRDIIELLQQCISTEDDSKASIYIGQDFLHDKKKCQIRLVGVMGRYKETSRWIVSEQDTRYENVHGDDAHYTHTCQYDQKISTSVHISKGHKFGIGAGLGGSGYGASVMVTPSYEYSWGKDHSTIQEKGESKTSSVDITVHPGTAVVVKEVVYNVEKTGSSKFNLILRKDEKIPYHCTNDSTKPKSVAVKTLWENHLSRLADSRFNWSESVEDGKPVLICPFIATCCCYTTERSMETIKQICDPTRTQRILSYYDSEVTMIRKKTEKI
jgi:hypothetical protein